jgi:putative salt-induced outer membrane protein YdiY
MNLRRSALLGAAVVFGLCGLARADEVIFKNGDKLTGTIVSADGGKLVITSKVAGKITVDLNDVLTFSTDVPLKVKLQDGTTVNQKIAADTQPGTIDTAPGGTLQPQTFPLAQIDKINEPPVAWTGAIVVNGLFTHGNSNTSEIGVSGNAVRRSETDRISADAAYLFSRSTPKGGTSVTTEDNWILNGEYQDFFTKKFYGYANVGVQKDRINNLDLRLTPGIGIGYQWVERPDFNISTEAGGTWVYQEFRNVSTPQENFSARIAYHIDKSLWDDKVKLFHDLEFLPGIQHTNDYIVTTDIGLRAAITENMFSELKAIFDFDSKPAPGAVKFDTKYLIGVGWKF